MLTPAYDLVLILASVAVSVMASLAGLLLTRGISKLAPAARKFMIVMAAMALGGGIWSMHFVAMLAMKLPIEVDYDAAYTLGSMLIAILLTGIALLILHFAGRSIHHLALAGATLGNGIVIMHYIGMAGMRGAEPRFLPTGMLLGVIGATVLGFLAVYVSYASRTKARIFIGALMFGLSVVVVHFAAIHWTEFTPSQVNLASAPLVDHGTLAILVMISAFIICGAFLLTASNLVFAGAANTSATGKDETTAHFANDSTVSATLVKTSVTTPASAPSPAVKSVDEPRLPYERDKRTHFIASGQVAAIRAQGHYTVLYTDEDKLFCPLAISEVEKRVRGGSFLKTHRSYLVNTNKVSGFERRKDNGFCLLEGVKPIKAAPVSRGYVPVVREVLGL